MANRREEVQKLLVEAEKLIAEAGKICVEDDIDGVGFLDQTFRIYRRRRYGEASLRLQHPGWFSDEYWHSSSADCELALDYGEGDD